MGYLGLLGLLKVPILYDQIVRMKIHTGAVGVDKSGIVFSCTYSVVSSYK
jgi:hypothetical protein